MGNLHLQLSVSEHDSDTCSGAALVPPARNTRGFFIIQRQVRDNLFLVFLNGLSDSIQLNDAFDYHPGGQNMAWF
jgi:hypothetical protein